MFYSLEIIIQFSFMFTGITQGLFSVTAIEARPSFAKITIDLASLSAGLKVGDSVAVNGVCLTATAAASGLVSFDVMGETLAKSNLGELQMGDRVNAERSLRIGDRLDGHFVLGHVDGRAVVEEKLVEGDNCLVWLALPTELAYGLIPKGSIGVDGISLTIADIKEHRFAVALIPHTLEITTLGFKKKGDTVNIEIDYLGKWIKKLINK